MASHSLRRPHCFAERRQAVGAWMIGGRSSRVALASYCLGDDASFDHEVDSAESQVSTEREALRVSTRDANRES